MICCLWSQYNTIFKSFVSETTGCGAGSGKGTDAGAGVGDGADATTGCGAKELAGATTGCGDVGAGGVGTGAGIGAVGCGGGEGGGSAPGWMYLASSLAGEGLFSGSFSRHCMMAAST